MVVDSAAIVDGDIVSFGARSITATNAATEFQYTFHTNSNATTLNAKSDTSAMNPQLCGEGKGAARVIDTGGQLSMALQRAYALDVPLTVAQRTAIRCVSHNAAQESKAAINVVADRIIGLAHDFTAADAITTLEFIRDRAPIIIHFSPNRVLKLLARDTHYRYHQITKRPPRPDLFW